MWARCCGYRATRTRHRLIVIAGRGARGREPGSAIGGWMRARRLGVTLVAALAVAPVLGLGVLGAPGLAVAQVGQAAAFDQPDAAGGPVDSGTTEVSGNMATIPVGQLPSS